MSRLIQETKNFNLSSGERMSIGQDLESAFWLEWFNAYTTSIPWQEKGPALIVPEKYVWPTDQLELSSFKVLEA